MKILVVPEWVEEKERKRLERLDQLVSQPLQIKWPDLRYLGMAKRVAQAILWSLQVGDVRNYRAIVLHLWDEITSTGTISTGYYQEEFYVFDPLEDPPQLLLGVRRESSFANVWAGGDVEYRPLRAHTTDSWEVFPHVRKVIKAGTSKYGRMMFVLNFPKLKVWVERIPFEEEGEGHFFQPFAFLFREATGAPGEGEPFGCFSNGKLFLSTEWKVKAALVAAEAVLSPRAAPIAPAQG